MSRKHTTPAAKLAKSTARRVDKVVESSAMTNTRRRGEVPTKQQPRQPKLRPTPPRRPAPSKKRTTVAGVNAQAAHARSIRERVSAEITEAAAATGMLPHEWLLAVMRGEQINHYAYDSESQEIIEVIVLPTFADRIECAKSAAKYYATPLAPAKVGAGGPVDPAKQPGVMEVPIAQSMEKWAEIAQNSQSLLKKQVTE